MSYSGTAIAASLVGDAINHLFSGLNTGLLQSQQVRENEQKMGMAQRREAADQAFMPVQYQEAQARLAQIRQIMEHAGQRFPVELEGARIQNRRGEEDILTSREGRAQRAELHPGHVAQQQAQTEGIRAQTASTEFDTSTKRQLLPYTLERARLEPEAMRVEIESKRAQLPLLQQQIIEARMRNSVLLPRLQAEQKKLQLDIDSGTFLLDKARKEQELLPQSIAEAQEAFKTPEGVLSWFVKYGHLDTAKQVGYAYAQQLELQGHLKGGRAAAARYDQAERQARMMTNDQIKRIFGLRPTVPGIMLEEAADWLQQGNVARIMGAPPQTGPMPAALADAIRTGLVDQNAWYQPGTSPGAMVPQQIEAVLQAMEQGVGLNEAIAAVRQQSQKPAPGAPQNPQQKPRRFRVNEQTGQLEEVK